MADASGPAPAGDASGAAPAGDALDPAALRAVYDAQLRAFVPDRLPPDVTVDTDGPLLRVTGLDATGFVTYRSLGGVEGDELDALIARQRDFYAARGQALEWKLHGHDVPADLPDRLVAAGFRPEDRETVVIGLAAPLADPAPPLPEGVRLREVTERADLDGIQALKVAVWGDGRLNLADALEREIAADPAGVTVVVAETTAETTAEGGSAAGGRVVSAGWVRYVSGTRFATLWGGATLPPWRGRGIYRALVAYRAWLAVSRGYEYLQVDASDDSRPILQRCGFVAVTTTTPYIHPSP